MDNSATPAVVAFERGQSISRCIACHSPYSDSREICPRCGVDLQAWQAWTRAGLGLHLARFFLGSGWGWLALVSLSLPLLLWNIFDFPGLSFAAGVMVISLLFGLISLLILFVYRDGLWVDELVRRISPQFQTGLIQTGGICFLMAATAGVIIGLAQEVITWLGGTFQFTSGWVIVLIGLAFAGQTLAAGLYSLFVYGRWLLDRFPPPIFLDETRLLQLIEPVIKSRIKAELENDQVPVIKVVKYSRTEGAGLNLQLRIAVLTDRRSAEGHYIQVVQHWRVISDKWGHVKRCRQEGLTEYEVDPKYGAGQAEPKRLAPPLEGEIILPASPPLPTVEEKIIRAMTAQFTETESVPHDHTS